ncbi:hypothetical protein CSA37_00125 [Candidatus Fermentibacteria bacterium]|nr:MAG: hypothetical protein CSA37_00125 [Candidatus Fermentibacteria bacterium]
MKKNRGSILVSAAFLVFVLYSAIFRYTPGRKIASGFLVFAKAMLFTLPGAFIIIGLFHVWVSREKVEKHLGSSSFTASLWMILLAGTTVGGLYVAFPVAGALWEKGAKTQVILSYLGFAAVCRIPMTVFEASFMGIKFTVVRLLVSIPLVLLSSMYLASVFQKRGWTVRTDS